MRRSLFFFITVLLLLGFTSCSIHKRVYRPGFAIDWNRNDPGETIIPSPGSSKSELKQETSEKNNSAEEEEVKQRQVLVSSSDDDRHIASRKPEITERFTQLPHLLKIYRRPVLFHHSSDDDKLPLNPLVLTGCLFVLLSILSWLIPNLTRYLGLYLPYSDLLIWSSLFAPILAIIFCARGLREIKKNPGAYRGRTLGLVGLGLGILILAIWIIYIGEIIAFLL
jgi:hypothetical protein